MSKHTPDPWTIEPPPINDFGASLAIMGPREKGGHAREVVQVYIAEVFKVNDDISRMSQDVEGKANARLIVKAPKMYKALKALVEDIEGRERRTGIILMAQSLDKARKILREIEAKA